VQNSQPVANPSTLPQVALAGIHPLLARCAVQMLVMMPSVRCAETTYVFFGKRGSGKTTIRMEMQQVRGRVVELTSSIGHIHPATRARASETNQAVHGTRQRGDCSVGEHSSSLCRTAPRGVAIEAIMAAHLLQAYRTYNEIAVELGRSRGHFLVDLCRPGHMTACLRTFQETIHCNDDNWDAHFGALPSTVAARNPPVLQQ